jgi:MFS family permease
VVIAVHSGTVSLNAGIFQTLAWDINSMYAGRIISGCALFAMMISISMFNAEMAPKEIRGRLIGIQRILQLNPEFMVTFGTSCAYWLNYGLSKTDYTNKDARYALTDERLQYMLPFALQVVPCFLLCVGMLFVPSSPRWLAMKGRTQEARKALSVIRELPLDDPNIESEMKNIVRFLDHHDTSTWAEVFSSENLNRLSVGVLLRMCC